MAKYEYGKLLKKTDRINYSWIFSDGKDIQEDFDEDNSFLDVLNSLGENGWILSLRENKETKSEDATYILYRKI